MSLLNLLIVCNVEQPSRTVSSVLYITVLITYVRGEPGWTEPLPPLLPLWRGGQASPDRRQLTGTTV